MAINKNFVVKNGLEVSTDLILADADTNKVGIGTTAPQYTLHVAGGIGATDFYLTGIGTFVNELNVGLGGTVLTVLGVGNSIGIGTALPAFLLDVRAPVSTGQTALYVQGDVRITGDLVVEDDLVLDEVTARNITVSNQATTLNFSATGVGTITTLNSTSGTITNLTGTSGTITTFNSTNGTITNLTGTAGTITTLNSTNGTITNLTGTAGTIGTVKIVSGIITATSGVVTYFGDGNFLNLTSNPSRGIGIGTTGGVVGYAVTFIDFKGAGVSTTQYNSNTGIATIFFEGGGGGGGGTIGIGTEFPLSSANGDLFFSAEFGRLFIYYDENIIGVGTDEFWIDAAPFNVDLSQLDSLSLINLTVSNNTTVGNVNSSGIITASAFFGNGSGLTGVGIGSTGSINTVGIITASEFFGDGSGLTGAGSTVFNDTTTNQEFFPLFTATTSGTITASGISTSKLTYNPSTGAVTAVDFNSTSDINLKENIHTVGNALEITEQLRGVSFDWKETGKGSYGVIAQELEEVLPELVKQGEVKSVNYNGIIGVLIEAMKELKAEVKDLKNTK